LTACFSPRISHSADFAADGNGTNSNSKAGMYDEAGYLALPPCLWGEEKGLYPSILLPPNTPLVSIKKNRNTHQGHFVRVARRSVCHRDHLHLRQFGCWWGLQGEMASWQMRGINF
jgi:hypothetical protein